MDFKIYESNYINTLGKAFLILSANENQDNYVAENILIFHESDKQKFIFKYNTIFNKIHNFSFDDFILDQIRVCEDHINTHILDTIYNHGLDTLEKVPKFELKGGDKKNIRIIINELPDFLNEIIDYTINQKLRETIKNYQTILKSIQRSPTH